MPPLQCKTTGSAFSTLNLISVSPEWGFLHLLYRREANAQTNLCIYTAVSLEPSILTYTKNGCR